MNMPPTTKQYYGWGRIVRRVMRITGLSYEEADIYLRYFYGEWMHRHKRDYTVAEFAEEQDHCCAQFLVETGVDIGLRDKTDAGPGTVD